MKTLVTALLFLCSICAFAAGNGVKVPPYERVPLGNGAVVLLMERHDVPLIAFSAVLRGGAVSDPAGGSGVASLLAGLLQKGAGARDAVQFAETVASVGGQIETSVSTESISVNGSFLARDQQLMVELVADLLQRPRLEQAQFDTLRARQIEFIRAAKESDLGALAPIYGESELFAGHPYGRSVDGSEASLAAIKHADLQRYYQEQVGADRLILAVAGDFKAAQLKQRISRAFSGWRKAGTALPPLPKAERVASRRVLLVDAPESVQAYFWAGNVAVAKSDPRRPSLDVTNTLFGGRFTSMLNTELRIRTGLSYSASSRFDRLLQPGHWEMSSFTQTDTTIQALDLMLATLDQLHATGLDPKMVESGKSYVQGQFPLALETSEQWAAQLATLEFYGLDRRYIDDYSQQLGTVTAADSKKVIDEVFPPSTALAIVVIGNAGAIRDGLRKYGPITEMKLADPTFAPVRNE
ncbi:MAG TPA: pitrilysin family protein [Steroidobacteraceae bacterium]|nr:pitrilysin family protein [Steroidobacteraceae bacterium]